MSREAIMSAPVAFCPRCRAEVAFIEMQNVRRCPICGFEFETVGPGAGKLKGDKISGWGLLLRFVLVAVAVIMVTLAVAFVGCVAALKGL